MSAPTTTTFVDPFTNEVMAWPAPEHLTAREVRLIEAAEDRYGAEADDWEYDRAADAYERQFGW